MLQIESKIQTEGLTALLESAPQQGNCIYSDPAQPGPSRNLKNSPSFQEPQFVNNKRAEYKPTPLRPIPVLNPIIQLSPPYASISIYLA